MRVFRNYFVLAGFAMAAATTNAAAAADNANLGGDPFALGLEAYFSGDRPDAEQRFAEAISRDPHDPRPHYYRALCLRQDGRAEEARAAFVVAALLEARSRGRYPVDDSLLRVKGEDRLALEQYRWQVPAAEIDAIAAKSTIASNPSAQITMRTDAGALRQQVSVPLERLVQPVSLAELASLSTSVPQAAPATSTSNNPFTDDPRSDAVGKIPSGKLLGILGRAFTHAAPWPSLDRWREKLPELSSPGGRGQSSPPDAQFDSNATLDSNPNASPTDDDPFAQPAAGAPGPKVAEPKTSEPKNTQPPVQAAEEDPFG
jgi:tetratricopeptide (TPR) repeat protein